MTSGSAELRVLLGHGTLQNGSGDGFTFDGHAYRGGAQRSFATGSVINTVSLEAYLYSVVPREMSPLFWHRR